MDKTRSDQILGAGINAAQERLRRNPGKSEYPRDYHTLYRWLEDRVFDLYEAIMLRKKRKIFEIAGDIIFNVSEIAELSYTEILLERHGEFIKAGRKNEVFDNKH